MSGQIRGEMASAKLIPLEWATRMRPAIRTGMTISTGMTIIGRRRAPVASVLQDRTTWSSSGPPQARCGKRSTHPRFATSGFGSTTSRRSRVDFRGEGSTPRACARNQSERIRSPLIAPMPPVIDLMPPTIGKPWSSWISGRNPCRADRSASLRDSCAALAPALLGTGRPGASPEHCRDG